MMGHLNSFSASGGGNLNKNFPKIQMPGELPGGGKLKLRFDWYIISVYRVIPQYFACHGGDSLENNTINSSFCQI